MDILQLADTGSTTNWAFKFLTMSVVGFVLLNFIMNYLGVTVELDPVLSGFVGSIIGFIIGKKGAKKDSTELTTPIEEVAETADTDTIESISNLVNKL